MPTSSADSSLQSLARVLGHARYVFGALLLLTVALLTWHHYGMEKVIDLTAEPFQANVEDDRSGGGVSQVSLERHGRAYIMRCHIVKKVDWPFCKLQFSFTNVGAAGIDMSGFSHITVDATYEGPGPTRLGMVLVNAEEGLTRPDQWQTYKINQADAIELPREGALLIPLRWFSVAQWWKDMVKPPLEHSFTQIDNVVRAELMTPVGPGEGEHILVVHSMRVHGKLISQNALLMGLVAVWILCAVSWPTITALILRRQLRESDAALALLGEVNEALELEARELAGQAHIDPLTGVLNRQGLRAALMSTSTLMADPMSVVFIDIDHFKAINDTHGHGVGDDVLRQFANAVAAGTRSSDRLVRWGGEEFLIVCPMTDVHQAKVLAENLRRKLHQQIWPVGLRVTASFGVAQHRATDEIGVVIKHADEELYKAKASGRDRVHAYDTDCARHSAAA